MITKLSQVTTAAELITFTKCFGIPTKQEDICTMQDIIGHTAVENLIDLANDNGFGTGKPGTQAQMMAILYHIWHWEDATRFYNNYVNPITKHLKEQVKEAEDRAVEADQKYKSKVEELNNLHQRYNNKVVEYNTTEKLLKEADEKVRAQEAEILKLKAMLFDMMMKTA